jgi:hypothetical protein
LGGGRDFGRGLVGELGFEFLEEELLVVAGLGVAAQDEGAAVGCGEADIEHLDGGELVEDGSGGEAGGVLAQTAAHDMDAHFHGFGAAQHIGVHEGTVLGEGVGAGLGKLEAGEVVAICDHLAFLLGES